MFDLKIFYKIVSYLTLYMQSVNKNLPKWDHTLKEKKKKTGKQRAEQHYCREGFDNWIELHTVQTVSGLLAVISCRRIHCWITLTRFSQRKTHLKLDQGESIMRKLTIFRTVICEEDWGWGEKKSKEIWEQYTSGWNDIAKTMNNY